MNMAIQEERLASLVPEGYEVVRELPQRQTVQIMKGPCQRLLLAPHNSLNSLRVVHFLAHPLRMARSSHPYHLRLLTGLETRPHLHHMHHLTLVDLAFPPILPMVD